MIVRWFPLTLVLIGWTALAQEHEHQQANKSADDHAFVIGRLVDATWFLDRKKDSAGQDQTARALNSLAAGTPAGLLPEGSSKPEDIWYLLTNATVLAPYAGKILKVEGASYRDIRAIEPSAVYLQDGAEWREIQLKSEQQKAVTATQRQDASSTEHEQGGSQEPRHGDHPEKEHDEETHEAHGPASQPAEADHDKHKIGGDERAAGESHHEEAKEPAQEHDHERQDHWYSLEMPPVHPLLVNFTAGLFPAAVLFEWLGRLFRRQSLASAGCWMLLCAALVTPFTALAGWRWFHEAGHAGHGEQMIIHQWIGIALAIMLPLLAIWRGLLYARNRMMSWTYLGAASILLFTMILQGHLGAMMSF